MAPSILTSTKKVLGLDEGYDAFDADIITFINSALSVLDQLGVGAEGGFFITGPEEVWDDLNLPDNQLNLVRTYLFLRVRMLFDPPTTSFLLSAWEKQLEEYEYRLRTFVETATP
jgi:hypothetical protein